MHTAPQNKGKFTANNLSNCCEALIFTTYAEILTIYQLNSGNFLRHGSLYYA